MFEGESDDHTAYWFNVNWDAQNWSAWFGVNNENRLLTPHAWPNIVYFVVCCCHCKIRKTGSQGSPPWS